MVFPIESWELSHTSLFPSIAIRIHPNFLFFFLFLPISLKSNSVCKGNTGHSIPASHSGLRSRECESNRENLGWIWKWWDCGRFYDFRHFPTSASITTMLVLDITDPLSSTPFRHQIMILHRCSLSDFRIGWRIAFSISIPPHLRLHFFAHPPVRRNSSFPFRFLQLQLVPYLNRLQ